MNKLEYSLIELTKRVRTGSFATQANRQAGLIAIAGDLKQLGFAHKEMRATALKTRHVTDLVAKWKREGIADATIRNRLGWVRWWAEQIGKPGVMPTTNESFGLAERTPYQGNRARQANADTLARVADQRIRLALKLEAAFGLRREEALKFRPAVSDHGDHLALVPSTTKGGRYREIPLTHPSQRALLEEVHAVAGDGSLIPDGMKYEKYMKSYKHKTRAAGLGNANGLRHAYAQWRYKRMTGWAAPKAGGPTIERMTPAEAARDRAARLQISRELGHNRLDIADTYLGRAKAPKAAA